MIEMLLKKRKRFAMSKVSSLFFLLPAGIPLVLFWIIPIFFSVLLSFTDWDMISDKINFLGMKNYLSLLRESDFLLSLKNTFLFSVGSIIPTIIVGLLLALGLSKLKNNLFWKAVIFLPYITPMVAVSIVWSWIFDPQAGILNYILSYIGVSGMKWLQDSQTAMIAVIIVTVWKQIGWAMLFFLNAIIKIPSEILEAASIDGANEQIKFTKIILPAISPTTFFVMLMATINSLQAYDQIQVLTQGGPAGATRTVLYYYYLEAFDSFNVGKASAVAIVIVLFTIVLSLIEKVISNKFVYYD